MHEKSEAFLTLKNFKACVEKETRAYITCLKTNRGGEFNSNEFGELCQSQDISGQFTIAYTPVERSFQEEEHDDYECFTIHAK